MSIEPIGLLTVIAGLTVPLGPVSSNFTQSVYLFADLICFTIAVAIASTRAGFLAVTNALLAFAAANVLFALLDIGARRF
jgi:hypothetical protein